MGKAILTPIDNPEKVVKASNCMMSDGTTNVEEGITGVDNKLNYSTSEHIVGKWTDGKTLYEKTISFGALPNNTSKQVNHSISSIDKVVVINGFSIRNDNAVYIPIPYPATSGMITCYVSKTSITLIANSNMSEYDRTYITLRYTKTS